MPARRGQDTVAVGRLPRRVQPHAQVEQPVCAGGTAFERDGRRAPHHLPQRGRPRAFPRHGPQLGGRDPGAVHQLLHLWRQQGDASGAVQRRRRGDVDPLGGWRVRGLCHVDGHKPNLVGQDPSPVGQVQGPPLPQPVGVSCARCAARRFFQLVQGLERVVLGRRGADVAVGLVRADEGVCVAPGAGRERENHARPCARVVRAVGRRGRGQVRGVAHHLPARGGAHALAAGALGRNGAAQVHGARAVFPPRGARGRLGQHVRRLDAAFASNCAQPDHYVWNVGACGAHVVVRERREKRKDVMIETKRGRGDEIEMESPSVCLVFLYIMDGDRAASGWCMVFVFSMHCSPEPVVYSREIVHPNAPRFS